VAQNLEEKVTEEYLWCGRDVKVIDGSTVSMPDTVENQKEYPQPSSQKPGCGFPIAKIAVIFSLVTGAATALCIDVLNTHDIKLARMLYSFLSFGSGSSFGFDSITSSGLPNPTAFLISCSMSSLLINLLHLINCVYYFS
jgi:hypothetical protein